jgi:hypothetical protein
LPQPREKAKLTADFIKFTHMTNRSSSKQHGLSNVHNQRPKSKLRNRRNKENAKINREKRQAELAKLITAKKAA